MQFPRKFLTPMFASCTLAAAMCAEPGSTPATGNAAKPGSTATQPGKLLSHLDPDNNGLYDNKERKALLDEIQRLSPGLEATFDADGDGMVTVAEQTKDRHPLSMLVPRSITEKEDKIPWALDIFPEWIYAGYLQEDVVVGPVAEVVPRGLMKPSATLTNANKQPKKAAAGSGIEFAANSGQQLTMPGHKNARWDFRWTILNFRIDPHTGTDADTLLVDINSGEDPSQSSPKIWYHMDLGLHVQYVGRNQDWKDTRLMVAENVVADGKTWNVLVCGIRYGQMFASVNGVPLKTEEPQPERYSAPLAHNGLKSYIGDPGQGHMAWALDALVFGMTEPTEAMVEKMTGWAAHRLGFQANLPQGHPYRTVRPVLDAEDLPARYVHNEEKWTEWGEKATDKSITRVNAGGERVEPKGFERVFYDDFRAFRITPSTSGEGSLWQAPGWNTAVGVAARMVEPGHKSDAFQHDKEDKKQTLSLVKEGDGFVVAGMYTQNDLGYGYAWAGPKVFRVRCMFPETPQDELAPGLFPAFWSYDNDFLFWRTANRTEVDYFELDGKYATWLNALSTHHHYSHLRENIFAKQPGGYKRYKVYGGEMTEKKGKIPGGLYVWDGQYHTWEYVIDEDMTYVNVTIPGPDGKDKWVEICRAPTAPTYLQNLDLQLNMALKARKGRAPRDREDFYIDFVEVLQKTSALAEVPKPFTAKPSLSGSTAEGATITCTANVEGVTDLRYFWFADDYPLTYGASNTYTVTADAAGKPIRCMVKAVGALDSPQAWSEVLK